MYVVRLALSDGGPRPNPHYRLSLSHLVTIPAECAMPKAKAL